MVLQAGKTETLPSEPPGLYLDRPSSSTALISPDHGKVQTQDWPPEVASYPWRPGPSLDSLLAGQGVCPPLPQLGAMGRSGGACDTSRRSCCRGPWVSVLPTVLACWWGRPSTALPGGRACL